MTVGKTYVADRIRESKLEILRLRRKIKNRRPRPLPRNLIWGPDLTYVEEQPVLGIVDHGTRACIALHRIRTKAPIAILREILDLVERFGSPRSLHTDNEPVLTSKIFRFGFCWLGIQHQRTAVLLGKTDASRDFSGPSRKRFDLRPAKALLVEIFGSSGFGTTIAVRISISMAEPRLMPAWSEKPKSASDRPAFFSEWDELAGFFFPP